MEDSGEPHVLASLTSRKEPQYPVDRPLFNKVIFHPEFLSLCLENG